MRGECILTEVRAMGKGPIWLSTCCHPPSEDGVMCWQLGANMQNKAFWRNFETED